MLYFNAIRLLYVDMKSSALKMGCYLILLFSGLIFYANYTPFMVNKISVPDVFHVLFRTFSLTIIVIPVFLLLLSLILPSILEPLRIIRYQNRRKLATVLFVVIGLFVCVFLFIYMLSGILYGWWLSGSLANPWMTETGLPFIVSDGKVDLALFSTGYMVLRYVGTEIVAFIVIGLLATFIYLIIPRFVYVFFIIEGLVILDGVLSSHFRFTLFMNQAEISIGRWGDVPYFVSILAYFLGLIVILSVAIYIVVSRKDFIPILEESS